MSEEWYYIDAQGGQQGPVTVAVFAQHFQSGKCNEQSACWSASLPDWAIISSVEGLLAKLKPAPAPTPARGPVALPGIGARPGPGPGPAVARPGPAAAAAPAPAPAPAAAPAAASNDWQTLRDNTGREYYYNARTGQTSWDKPADMKTASSAASAISSMAAQRPQKLAMEKLGAPEPVSSGVVNTAALNVRSLVISTKSLSIHFSRIFVLLFLLS